MANPIVNPFQVVETGPVSNGQSNRNSVPNGGTGPVPNGQSIRKSIPSDRNTTTTTTATTITTMTLP